jgi:hypothetical protein
MGTGGGFNWSAGMDCCEGIVVSQTLAAGAPGSAFGRLRAERDFRQPKIRNFIGYISKLS